MDEKVVLVTGSTSGIGKEIAKELLLKGYKVIINSYEDVDVEFMQKEFGSDKAFFCKADISKGEDLSNLKAWILNKFGRLDYLVANAGICPLPCGVDDISDENIDRTIDVNLKGTFKTLKILGNLIKETSKNGSIVAITSVDGIIGEPYATIYSATKAGIISLTKSFARYFSNPLIRVNAVAPGLIDTPLTDSTGEELALTIDVSIIKRIGEPNDVANMVVFLLSDEASYVTGQVIAVDGGFTLK